jgi:hypothetical protein
MSESDDKPQDLVETCLRVFYGEGRHGWDLLKMQMPDSTLEDKRNRIARIIEIAQQEARKP